MGLTLQSSQNLLPTSDRHSRRRLSLRRPSPSFGLPFREGVDILLTRAEEIEKVQTSVFAGLAHAEEHEIFLDSFLGRCTSNDLAQRREGFNCMLRVIVVPRHSIVAQKGEEFVTVLFKAFFAFQSGFTLVVGSCPCGNRA